MKLKVSLAIMVIVMIAMFAFSPHDDRFSEAVARGWNWQEVQMGRNGLLEAVQVPIPKRIEMSVTLVIEELIP